MHHRVKRSPEPPQQPVDHCHQKKLILTIVDSIIKNFKGPEDSRVNSAETRSHPGATTEDFIDLIKPTACKKPDIVIIHTGPNDTLIKVITLKDLTNTEN